MEFSENDKMAKLQDAIRRVLNSDDFKYIEKSAEFLKCTPFEFLEGEYNKQCEAA